MICSQKKNHKNRIVDQSQTEITLHMSITEMDIWKERLLRKRDNLLESLISQIVEVLTSNQEMEEHFYSSQLQSQFKPVYDQHYLLLEEATSHINQIVQQSIDDYTAQNICDAIISNFVTQYQNEFNQISDELLIKFSTPERVQHYRAKRICKYIQQQGYIPNQSDRILEIQRKLLSSKISIECESSCQCFGEGFSCLNQQNSIECQHASICKNQSISLGIYKKLGVDVIVHDTFGLDLYSAKFLYLLVADYDDNYQEIFSNLNMTNGNLQQALSITFNQKMPSFEGIPITPKGKGVICCSQTGFPSETYINCYFGELYSPARWYEKQTVNNKRNQEGNIKLSKISPSAMFELDGDLLFIDPSRYGNYTQHLNYSCQPNCALKQYDSNGRKYLALFTTRSIRYLEELTLAFPKNHSEKCYCGSVWCKRSQVTENSKVSLNYIEKNVLLLKSGQQRLENPKLSETLTVGIPNWAISWSVLVGNIEKDTNNIIACVDKVKYLSDHLDCDLPPIQIIQSVFEIFWSNTLIKKKQSSQFNDSIFQEIFVLLNRHKDQEECNICIELITVIYKEIKQHTLRDSLTRLTLLVLSEIIMKIKKAKFNNEGLGLTFYFMAFTHTYFSATKYGGIEGEQFEESELEYIQQPKNKAKLSLSRQYTPQYMWGQLINWNKQTLQNPQSSMAQDRRGLLCYPSILLSFDNNHKTFPHLCKTKEQYFTSILSRDEPQPDIAGWSYQNNYNLFGTIFFEQYYSESQLGEGFVNKLCQKGLESFDIRLKYWIEIEMKFDQSLNADQLQQLYETHFKHILQTIENKNTNTIQLYKFQDKLTKKLKLNNTNILVIEGDTVFEAFQQ